MSTEFETDRRPAIRLHTSQPRARFSFLPDSSEQLRNAHIDPSSPTYTDIETDTVASLSPRLAPISRPISMIVEQRMKEERAQRHQAQQHVPYSPAQYVQAQQYPKPQQYQQSIPEHQQVTYPAIQQSQQQLALQQAHAAATAQVISTESAGPRQAHHRPQLSLQTQLHDSSNDTKDPSTIQPPYYLQPPAEPHPNDFLEIKQPIPALTQEVRLPSNTLFPAYKPQATATYTPLAAPDGFSRETTMKDEKSHEWNTSFCANSVCCLALFCPCIVYGKTQYRLDQKSEGKPATDLLAYSATNTSCAVLSLGCCFSGLMAMVQRTRVRKAYGIDGSCGDDCMRGCCCCCCVLAQDESEMLRREEKLAEKRSNVGYVPPGGMIFAPPPAFGT